MCPRTATGGKVVGRCIGFALKSLHAESLVDFSSSFRVDQGHLCLDAALFGEEELVLPGLALSLLRGQRRCHLPLEKVSPSSWLRDF